MKSHVEELVEEWVKRILRFPGNGNPAVLEQLQECLKDLKDALLLDEAEKAR